MSLRHKQEQEEQIRREAERHIQEEERKRVEGNGLSRKQPKAQQLRAYLAA